MRRCFVPVAAAAVAAILVACSPQPRRAGSPAPSAAPSAQVSPSAGLPPITVHSQGTTRQPVRIVEQQNNRKIYELLAQSTESTMQSQNQFRGSFAKTHVTFYGTDGSTLIGDAPLTTIDKASERVTMQGGVRARTSEGITLQCDQLEYNRTTGQLHGTGNVHIVSSQGYTLSGGSFRSDLKLTHVHME